MRSDEPDLITDRVIDVVRILKNGRDGVSGATVLFDGQVRNHHQGRSVDYLEFETHRPMAEKIMRAILEDARRKWSLNSAVCVHRIGRVDIGESAIVILTAAAHRAEAYEANRYIIDRVKREVPVWKREFFSDGSVEWSRSEAESGVSGIAAGLVPDGV